MPALATESQVVEMKLNHMMVQNFAHKFANKVKEKVATLRKKKGMII